MKISTENPPHNIRELCEVNFDLKNKKPVFTFGDTIYNPHNGVLDIALLEHEKLHSIQQGKKPVEWWYRYFQESEFRFDQELEAYRVQYKVASKNIKGKNQHFEFLKMIAKDLSDGMYGNTCSFYKAMELIKNKDYA